MWDKPDYKEYLKDVVGSVEATNYEKHSLWIEYSTDAAKHGWGTKDHIRFEWISAREGWLPRVGMIGDRPVCISTLIEEVDGKKLLFWHATSELVDYQMIENWLKEHLPPAAFRGDGYLNRTDPTNFSNILR